MYRRLLHQIQQLHHSPHAPPVSPSPLPYDHRPTTIHRCRLFRFHYASLYFFFNIYVTYQPHHLFDALFLYCRNGKDTWERHKFHRHCCRIHHLMIKYLPLSIYKGF